MLEIDVEFVVAYVAVIIIVARHCNMATAVIIGSAFENCRLQPWR